MNKAETHPSSVMPQLIPIPSNIYVAKSGKMAPNKLLIIVLAAIADLDGRDGMLAFTYSHG